MTRSSPVRRNILSSPDRGLMSNFLHEDRNNELSHRDALAAAQAEHRRVREAAIRVYELHELKLEHKRIVEAEKLEEERLEAEAQIVAEEKRLRELKARTIPKPPPEPESTPDPPKPQTLPPASEPKQVKQEVTEPKQQAPVQPPPQAKPAPTINPFATSSTPASTPPAVTQAVKPVAAPTPAPVAPTPVQPSKPTIDRHTQIHQELKKLRKELQAQAKVAGSPMKGKLGEFRREIRVSIGQLTSGKGANAQPIDKITKALQASLSGQVASPPINVNLFMVDTREPVQGATNNNDTLPSLFIYLMNICAKAIINQFINECGANPKAADPIGVFTAHIFSNKDFQWRGQSMIDILMAKFRIVCPVLFGQRGNDKTERGRKNLGWKKDGGSWVTEQTHNDRMTGLGAGYASLSLRDFSKSSKSNPYPPTNYWKAFAHIVNTPANEICNTQVIVLRSMIEGHEKRFLDFFGTAALAALRLALVEFPQKAPPTVSAAGTLQALAEVLRSEKGLVFT